MTNSGAGGNHQQLLSIPADRQNEAVRCLATKTVLQSMFSRFFFTQKRLGVETQY